MGSPTGFLDFDRESAPMRAPEERVRDYRELYLPPSEGQTRRQAARCMDCGVPFCHSGCPLGNQIPEFNDAVHAGNWAYAYELLAATNNFPEFTGRICPAPCESACVLGIHQPPVAIEMIEKEIAERAFREQFVKPQPPGRRTGKRVAIVGSGPAGLAAASQLNQAGHWVTVFERDARPGGLLRYGVPDFKLEKWVIDRRLALMEREGIAFQCGVEVGREVSVEQLRQEYDAVLLCIGALSARELPVPGRRLEGIFPAMDYLTQQNRVLAGEWDEREARIEAGGRHVVVIGGGDTGSDCVGTANRQGAASVTQLTWGPRPPEARSASNPWPEWPMILHSSSSHEEGCERRWSVLIKGFEGDERGRVQAIRVARIRWKEGRKGFEEIEGSEELLPCGLALIALGFLRPEPELPLQLGLALDERGNLRAERYRSSLPGVFAAGDARRGASLVVWAISEGREAAREIDIALMGASVLPAKDKSLTAL
jgi:glutamate synthase (NADPH/NADH) small chain